MKKLLLIVLSFCIISSVYPAWFPNQINDIDIIDYYEDVETTGGWKDDGTTVNLVTSADNVGIGTSSPAQKLDVSGTIQTTNLLVTSFSDVTTGNFSTSAHGLVPKGTNVGDFLKDDGTWATAGGSGDITAVGDQLSGAVFGAGNKHSLLGDLIGLGSTSAESFLTIKPSGTGTSMILRVSDTSASDRLVIMQTGNVGIGITNPTQVLDVVGTIKATTFSGAGTSLTGTAASLTAGNVTTNADLTGPITSVGNATSIAAQTGTGTTFVVNTAPTIAGNALFSGNVGIGNSTPTQRLLVTGTISGDSGVYTALTVGGQNAVTVTTAHVGDVTGPIGGLTVVDDSHAHTGTTISTIDISDDTNLTDDTEIVLTDDTLSIAATITRDAEWNGLDFLVGTATGSLSAEIVAGTAPSGDLGGTWASPSVTDDSHAHIYSNIDITTSANWDDQVSDETGTGGAWVFASAPTMTGDVKFSGNVGIGISAPTQRLDIDGVIKWGNNTLPAGTGADGQLLTADGIGGVAWEAAGAADNLGNHIATQNIQLSTFYLSGDGGVEGVHVTAAGNVGVGTTGPTAKLHVNGNIISNDTLPLMRLNILNATADTLPGVALSIQKNYKITEIRAQSSGVGATNVIFSVALLTSDGTSVAHNLTTGQTATVAPLSVTSLTGGTVPSGYIVKPVIISTASTGTAPHFRFEAHGTEY